MSDHAVEAEPTKNEEEVATRSSGRRTRAPARLQVDVSKIIEPLNPINRGRPIPEGAYIATSLTEWAPEMAYYNRNKRWVIDPFTLERFESVEEIASKQIPNISREQRNKQKRALDEDFPQLVGSEKKKASEREKAGREQRAKELKEARQRKAELVKAREVVGQLAKLMAEQIEAEEGDVGGGGRCEAAKKKDAKKTQEKRVVKESLAGTSLAKRAVETTEVEDNVKTAGERRSKRLRK